MLIPAFLALKGFVKQHIDSYNYFVNHQIKDIIKAKNNKTVVSDVDDTFFLQYGNLIIGKKNIFKERKKEFFCSTRIIMIITIKRYKDIKVEEPSFETDSESSELTPHQCRISDLTYAGTIYVDIEYNYKGQNYQKRRVPIGK